MALTKIGATLGGSADIITVTQTGHGLLVGRPVRMTDVSGTPTYAYATAAGTATADAIGIIIAQTTDTLTIALGGRITVDECVPTGDAGTVLFLQVAAGLLAATEPSGNTEVSKPMAVITIDGSEMIMVQQRGEVISTAGISIADGSVTLAKLAHTNNSNDGLFLRHNGSGSDPTWVAATTDTTDLQNDIKQLVVTTNYLALRVTALASLGDYNLGNIMIDDFQDATGVDASASTNELRDSASYSYGSVSGGGFDSYVKLLLHFDNNLTDSSGSSHTVTNHSGAASDVTFEGTTKKFGSHSANFGASGTNRKLTASGSADFNLGTNPWSFDCWIYYTTSGELITTGHPSFRILIESNKLKFVGGGLDTYFSNDTFSTNTWYWIAIQRSTSSSSSNLRSWVNGSHWGTLTIANTNDIGSSSNALIIGHADSWFGTYMDEVRLSKGVARWPDTTADISIPASAYSTESITNMTLVSNATQATDASGSDLVPTKGDLLITYEDAEGTATLNTDLKGYISRNNGSTYTPGTLVAEGTIGTQKVAAFHDLDISGQSSANDIKYKIETLNQDANKQTKIHGVAMGWS